MADKHIEKSNRILEKVADGEIEPTGLVTVEMRDADTGKVVDREQAPNFIAKTWKAHARATLRLRWMQYGYNRQFIGQASAAQNTQLWPRESATVPVFPADSIACWNQTSAEDAANEHTPNIPATGIVAWASRWPFGSATGSRGNVSTAAVDSFVDDDTVRHVFDWTSSQGNGTFQSVGWLRMGAPGIHLCGGGTHHRARCNGSWTPSSHIAGATILHAGLTKVDPGTGTAYVLVRRQATSGAMRVVSFPAAAALDDTTLSILGVNADAGLTLTNVSSEFTPTSSVTSAEPSLGVLGRISGATVFTYPTATTASSTHRWGVITDGTATNTTYNFPTVGWICGAVIGTTLYASAGGDSNIYELNTSTGATINTRAIDSSVTTLCTLAGITTPRILEMTTDGTDMYAMYGQAGDSSIGNVLLVRLNTSGVLQQILGVVPHYQASGLQSEAASAPFAGTWGYAKSWWSSVTDYGGLTVDGASGGNTVEDTFTNNLPTSSGENSTLVPGTGNLNWVSSRWAMNMIFYDGSLFFGYWNANGIAANPVWTVYRQGFDLGSRVLLASSRTKAVGQTMRITYDVTLPGWF